MAGFTNWPTSPAVSASNKADPYFGSKYYKQKPYGSSGLGGPFGSVGGPFMNKPELKEGYQWMYDGGERSVGRTPSEGTIAGQNQFDYNQAVDGLSSAGRTYGGGGGGGGGSGSGSASGQKIPSANFSITPVGRETFDTPGMEAKQAAEFARAKDLAGLTARSALTGLEGAMAGRGIVGSGVEGRGMASIINQGQQQLGEVGRQQAITGAELAQRNAETAYQGGITQRGQDVSQQALDLERQKAQYAAMIAALQAARY